MNPDTPKPTPTITVHPAAAIFPMMSDEELASMAESIKQHGLREKIHAIISVSDETTDWEVLDGRNRLEALRRYLKLSDVDIIASYMTPVTMSGAYTPEEYVMMANIERRNLTQAQRRDLAGKLAIMLEERQKHLPKEEQTDTLQAAAEKTGVSRRTAATAKKEAKVKAKAPEVSRSKDKPAEPKFSPLKFGNAEAQLSNIYKSVTHEVTNEVGGKKVTAPYLDSWSIDEVVEVQARAKAVFTFLDNYLNDRRDRERAKLEKELAAMNKATS